ncbi:MAG: restriction endonuclease subunit S [Planctomycetes bacterium]|nr:restriction endonuclease subunit S [Planctomycetota bacterium]
MKWRDCRLGDVLTLKRGHDLPEQWRREGDVPVVTSSGITGFHNEAKAQAPGVVTGRYGTLGEVFYLEQDYWPHNTALYVVDFKGTHPRFASYFLTNVLRDYQSDKAAVPGVDRNVLHELKVRVPDKEIQEAIAENLQNYDELMENNRRRMGLLEETARLLYREWFVRLRFPGHEHTRLTHGVPEGWERKVLGDICTDIRESVLPEELEPDTPYIGLEHMPRRSISLTEWGQAEAVTSSKNRFKTGDILFGKIRPYFHKVGIVFTDGVASSDAIVIRPNSDELRSFTLMTVSSDKFVAEASQTMREGSKMPRADWKLMKRFSMALPPQGLLENFSETAAAITDQLRNLCFQNQKLKAARNLLLPKLMSGEIEV